MEVVWLYYILITPWTNFVEKPEGFLRIRNGRKNKKKTFFLCYRKIPKNLPANFVNQTVLICVKHLNSILVTIMGLGREVAVSLSLDYI